jgi:hypothetical protein
MFPVSFIYLFILFHTSQLTGITVSQMDYYTCFVQYTILVLPSLSRPLIVETEDKSFELNVMFSKIV